MKRCICGRSAKLPFCDGQHQKEGWTCVSSQKKIKTLGILSSENYFSLAEKLAHHLQADIVQLQRERSFYQKLIILTDGTQLDQASLLLDYIDYQEAELIAIGIPDALLFNQFLRITSSSSITSDASLLWAELLLALSKQTTPDQFEETQKIFLSHSTKDEAFLAPICKYLREYLGIKIFLCSDSIPSGDVWYQKIISELKDADLVIAIHSQNFKDSHFCSFEMGMTRALQKKLLIIDIDDSTLPVFLQDIQTNFLSKNREQKTWLDADEALIDLILQNL